MKSLTLEIYYERVLDRVFAERVTAALSQLVRELAPHIALNIHLGEAEANSLARTNFEWGGAVRDVPWHKPRLREHQSLLITNEDIGAQGWGWKGACVVSKLALETKAARGGDPADVLIHEWIHTLQGMTINGRDVPFADDAERMGFDHAVGPDGEATWHDWYSFALGAGD
jgi:hypothetical protein